MFRPFGVPETAMGRLNVAQEHAAVERVAVLAESEELLRLFDDTVVLASADV